MISALYILLIAVPVITLSFGFPKYLAGVRSGVYAQGRLQLDRRADPTRFRNIMIFLGLSYAVLAVMLVLSVAQAAYYFSG